MKLPHLLPAPAGPRERERANPSDILACADFLARPPMVGIPLIRRSNKRDLRKHRATAFELISRRLVELNQHYNFKYGKITIRNQKSRWGSCSKSGNLNFNYQILFLPAELRDYILVHELCHVKEFNHGKAFWELVAETIPDYKERRKRLRGLI
jgi:predicted metal-dependent hydrolase